MSEEMRQSEANRIAKKNNKKYRWLINKSHKPKGFMTYGWEPDFMEDLCNALHRDHIDAVISWKAYDDRGNRLPPNFGAIYVPEDEYNRAYDIMVKRVEAIE